MPSSFSLELQSRQTENPPGYRVAASSGIPQYAHSGVYRTPSSGLLRRPINPATFLISPPACMRTSSCCAPRPASGAADVLDGWSVKRADSAPGGCLTREKEPLEMNVRPARLERRTAVRKTRENQPGPSIGNGGART